METINALHYETMKPVRIEIAGGLITAVNQLEQHGTGEDLPIVAPGLVDNQVNGYAGIDFSGEELDAASVDRAIRSLWRSGVTTFLPTLVTGPMKTFERNLQTLSSVLADRNLAGSIPGFHLEGPWLSPLEGFRGCHREDLMSLPDPDQLDILIQVSGGHIRQVTLAPELPGALEMISHCREKGIVVAIGHSNASGEQIHRAADLGVTLSTHLGNGCANFIHRHQNPLWPQLADDRLIPTLIADGHHLLPDELRVFLKVKGPNRIILTSDITYLAGMPAGRYQFGGSDVILTEDGMLKSAGQDVLAGATFPLLKGVENMRRFTGCTLAEAITMASVNVAVALGLTDRGRLETGLRADLILFDDKAGNLTLRKCYVAGNAVPEENN